MGVIRRPFFGAYTKSSFLPAAVLSPPPSRSGSPTTTLVTFLKIFYQIAQLRVQGLLQPDCRCPLLCPGPAPFPRGSEISKCAGSSLPRKRNAPLPVDSSSISQRYLLTNSKRHGRTTWKLLALHPLHRGTQAFSLDLPNIQVTPSRWPRSLR